MEGIAIITILSLGIFLIASGLYLKLKDNKYWQVIIPLKITFKRAVLATLLETNKRLIFRIIILCAVSFIAGFTFAIDYSNLTEEFIQNLFMGAGAMMGGILAIVFTLNSFLLEQNQYLASTEFFHRYIHNTRERVYFLFLSVLVIVYFAFAYMINTGLATLGTNFFLTFLIASIGLAIICIDSLSEEILNRTNPIKAIAFLKADLLQQIKVLTEYGHRVGQSIPQLAPNVTSVEVGEDLAYRTSLKPFTLKIQVGITDLIYLAEYLQTQIKPSSMAIKAIAEVLVAYISMRKSNSRIELDPEYIMASTTEVQKFFEYPLVELNRLSNIFAESKRENLSLKIKELYEAIIVSSTKMYFTNRVPMGDNPLTGQFLYLFKSFIMDSFKNGQKEVYFQSHYSLKNSVIAIFENQDGTSFVQAIETISSLMKLYKHLGETTYIGECQKSLVSVLEKMSENYSIVSQHDIERILETIFQFSYTPASEGHYFSLFDKTLFSLKFNPLLINILNKAIETEDDSYISFIYQFLDSYRKSIRTIFEQNPRYANDYLLESITIVVTRLARITKKGETRNRNSFINMMMAFISLPTFSASARTNELDEIVDLLCSLAVTTFKELEEEDLMKHFIHTIDYILNKCKDNRINTLSHSLNNFHLLAIFLRKKQQFSLLQIIREDIKKYDLAGDELFRSLFRWRDDFAHKKLNASYLFDEETLNAVISDTLTEDLDEHIFSFYSICDEQCTKRQEHKDRIQKQTLIIMMCRQFHLLMQEKSKSS